MANTTTSTMLATTAMLTLAACGGSGSGSVMSSAENYAETLGSTQTRYLDGQSLTASSAMAVQMFLNYEDGSTELIPANKVSFQLGETGHPSLTFKGETYQFTEANAERNPDGTIDGYILEIDGDTFLYANLFLWGQFEQLADVQRNEYVQLIDYMVVYGSESDGYFGDFGSAVVGSATNPSVLGDFTSKSYDGVFVAEFNPQQYADGLRSGRADRHRLTGDLQFTANFESNNISANVSNIEERVYSQQENISSGNNIIGSLNLTAGNIVGNTFSGAVSADSALLTSLNATSLTGQYNGKFFGPDAEEVGGVLSGTTVEDSGNRNFIGMFKGATSE